MKIKKILFIFSIIIVLGLIAYIPESNSQLFPYYPPPIIDPIYSWGYGYVPIFAPGPIDPFAYFPLRTAAVVTNNPLTSLITPTVPTTTAPLLGVTTAITLAATGGINTNTLALLTNVPVPTAPVTTTPTIGATTALLLGGGVNTTTLLLLGIV